MLNFIMIQFKGGGLNMPITKINGTERTKKLIGNIVTDFQKRKPIQNHVDYFATLNQGNERSQLLTDENSGALRNVSILYLKVAGERIQAAIGNKTGNILIEQKPPFMSLKEAKTRILSFLEKIQPEKIAKSKEIVSKTENLSDIGFTKSTLDTTIGDFEIHEEIRGSNSACSGESFEEYKTL